MPVTPDTTDLVAFTVKVNGTAVESSINILEITVTKENNRIPFARILIADGNASEQTFAVSSSASFIPGNEIEILAGYHSDEQSIFKGIITRHGIRINRSKPGLLEVECRDKAVKMTVGRKSKTFTDITDSDVFDTVISTYDLDKQIEATTIQHEKLVQYQATDWDFINLRAEANNKVVFVDNGVVEIKAIPVSGVPETTASFGTNIIEFEGEIDARNQFNAVKTESWDPSGQETISAMGTDPGITGPGNLSPSDLAGVIGLGEYNLKHPGKVAGEELQAWADATLTRSRMAKCPGRVTIQGTATLKPGSFINLNGLGDRFNGDAFVSGVRHEISGGEWLSHVQFGMKTRTYSHTAANDLNIEPASGINPAIHGLQTGVVTQLQDDPDGQNRIKVRLPMVNPDEEGIWARIATLDAGDQRGSFILPEIGDEVIMGFLHDDPNHPVILGMLNSSNKPAPFTAADENHEKGFVTRSNIKIWFNDDKKTVEISTPGGNKIKLDEDKKEILLTDQNDNKIMMNSDGITLESSKDLILKATGDVKAEGVNIQEKASAQFKAEGSGGAELSTSGSAVIKGSIVQIN